MVGAARAQHVQRPGTLPGLLRSAGTDRTRPAGLEFRRERLPLPCLQTDDRLKEIDLAEWQGLRFDEVSSRYSEQYEIWRSHPHLLRMQTASGSTFPVLDLFERARLFWEDLLCD